MPTIREQFPTCTHLMIVDFEATCGPGVSKTQAEIVEVGAVLYSFFTLDVGFEEAPTFHRYIKPQIVPKITTFCTKLTGITQAMVDQAPTFETMIHEWEQFLTNNDCSADTVVFGCWTDFDIRQLRRELERNEVAFAFPNWIDLQKAYKIHQKKKAIQSVKKAIEEQGFEFIGQAHSALHDAQNTARLVPFCNW